MVKARKFDDQNEQFASAGSGWQCQNQRSAEKRGEKTKCQELSFGEGRTVQLKRRTLYLALLETAEAELNKSATRANTVSAVRREERMSGFEAARKRMWCRKEIQWKKTAGHHNRRRSVLGGYINHWRVDKLCQAKLKIENSNFSGHIKRTIP
jgi:hypothetical protein